MAPEASDVRVSTGKPKLLSALESKNTKAWIALYHCDTRGYYYTTHDDGEMLGHVTLTQAATRVVEVAQTIKPKVYRLELSEDVIKTYS